ncbi:reverse transcriptase domain-containing protein [Tanacetum coccineum]|uniref:Reverse transcriptase domain-containing protein n=1 Tax=Tanacetum coccineum TaxID=301880 RepID=A0ABQ5EHE0_9ASTR
MLSEDPVDARTLMEKIENYTMEDGVLYRKSYLGKGDDLIVEYDDYFTKWMEAKPLATIIGRHVGNKAVERENRSLLRGIKTRLDKGGSAWVEEVPNVLWACQTIKKTINGETPFSLSYDTEVVIPAEIDLPEERREIAAIREARYKQQAKKYYNKKVLHVEFKVGEFVLRKNEASRAANTGKL